MRPPKSQLLQATTDEETARKAFDVLFALQQKGETVIAGFFEDHPLGELVVKAPNGTVAITKRATRQEFLIANHNSWRANFYNCPFYYVLVAKEITN